MSKNETDSLFQLVKRMNKSEKRHFKLLAGRNDVGQGKFIRLFDQLDAMKKFDPALLTEKFTGISRIQLPNQKAFLYEYLLGCLRLSSARLSVDVTLAQMITNIRVLYDKCLYHDCIRAIDKAKQFAIANERNVLLYDIFELEKLVTPRTLQEKHEERVNKTTLQSNEVLEQLSKQNSYRNAAVRMNTFYVKKGFIRDRNDLREIKSVFEREFPAHRENELGFAAQLHRYNALIGYYFFIRDFKRGYVTAKNWVKLFADDEQKIKAHTELYIRALNSFLVAKNKLGLLSEFEQTHRDLIRLKRMKVRWSDNINLHLFKAIYVHEINRHFMMGEFRSGTRIVARLESDLERFIPLLDHHSILIFYYKIACLYFGADQYKRALHWLNRIINEKDIAVREDLHAFARILALICHSELGNERLTKAHTMSLYRFLVKKGDLTQYDRLIIGFLRQLDKGMSRKKMMQLYVQLKEKLLPLTKHQFERRSFLYFDIITWLESKISGKTMESIVKSAVKRRTSAE
ncbi:MAG TPA: hypothetical protein VL651_11770 [Bacteroidia bacterium]|jgi:hypothetical protein|nr:hypothetical protein [Bacteroidia bacterium]